MTRFAREASQRSFSTGRYFPKNLAQLDRLI
jgi:hypothetical protein